MKEPVPVTGVWLRTERVDDPFNDDCQWTRAVVLVEVEGRWRRCVVEDVRGGPTSHIIEPAGIWKSPLEPVVDHK